jgi:hypothetical protein
MNILGKKTEGNVNLISKEWKQMQQHTWSSASAISNPLLQVQQNDAPNISVQTYFLRAAL